MSNDSSIIEQFKTALKEWAEVKEFFLNFKDHLYDFSTDMLGYIFEFLTKIIIHTPMFIFTNSYVKTLSVTLMYSSVAIVTIGFLYEMILKVINKKHTEPSQIYRRFALATGISGFIPFALEKVFSVINVLSSGIIAMGGNFLRKADFTDMFHTTWVDALGIFFFDIALIALLIPVALQNGRRLWDLFCLTAISPLALTAWVFERHEHLYHQWLASIKQIATVQLVYASFITLMGVFIYGSRLISPDMWIFKILIIGGALQRLQNPPNFIQQYLRGENKDIVSTFDDMLKSFTQSYNVLTFKNFKPLNYFRKQKAQTSQRNALRQQHGRRYVENLIK